MASLSSNLRGPSPYFTSRLYGNGGARDMNEPIIMDSDGHCIVLFVSDFHCITKNGSFLHAGEYINQN